METPEEIKKIVRDKYAGIVIEGEKSILMTDYGIKPPKALLGTIKTGNKINIIFKIDFETKNL